MSISLKHINSVRKRLSNGTVRTYHYHRRTGKRIYGDPGTPEFLNSYHEASVSAQPDNNSTSQLIRDYRKSVEFTSLANKTKRDYRRYLDQIEGEFGNMPIAALDDKRVREDFLAWRNRFGARHRSADYAWSVLQSVLSWAQHRGRIDFNHAIKPRRLYRSDRSQCLWNGEAIARFREYADIELQFALDLALLTAQRQGDILSLTWNQISDETITFRQSKTDRIVNIPLNADLRFALNQIPRRGAFVLTTKTGRPWKPDHFRHKWRKATCDAGLDGLHFHDLRGTAITTFAEAGCTSAEIATISGHSLARVEQILDVYLGRTEELAQSAMRKLENASRTKTANQLQTRTNRD